jgi:hypothetical protein
MEFCDTTFKPRFSVEKIEDMVDEIMIRASGRLTEVWGFTVEESLTLLLQFEWDKSKVEEALSSEDGFDKTRMKYGLTPNSKLNYPDDPHCMIDYSDLGENRVSLKCGHNFCGDCWENFLTERIRSQGAYSIVTKCMMENCPVVVPYSIW